MIYTILYESQNIIYTYICIIYYYHTVVIYKTLLSLWYRFEILWNYVRLFQIVIHVTKYNLSPEFYVSVHLILFFLHLCEGLITMLMDNTNLSVNQYRPSIYPWYLHAILNDSYVHTHIISTKWKWNLWCRWLFLSLSKSILSTV